MATAIDDTGPLSWLACRAGPHVCALPLAHVIEIMRPLPVEPFARAPDFMRGLSIVRGAPVPVVDARGLLGEPSAPPRRWVTVTVNGRVVALSFDMVLGIYAIAPSSSENLPPLLKSAAGEVVMAVGTLDAELLLFLQTARIFPEALRDSLGLENGVS